MRRKPATVFCTLAFIATLLFATTVQAEVTLTFNTYFPPTHHISKLTEEWAKEVQKRSKGALVIKYFAGGQLLKAPKVADGVAQGIADIGVSNLGYSRGRFPEMELCDLPLGSPSGWVSTHLVDRFYRKFKPKAMGKYHVLFMHGCGPNVISTVSKPIGSLKDLKGVTIRGTGRVSDTLQALGAVPRPIAITEIYESLQRKVIEGIMMPAEVLKAFRLGEVTHHCTASWRVGNIYTFYCIMNKAKYDALPDKIKKILDETSAEWVEKMALGWNQLDITGLKYFEEKGGKVIRLDEQQVGKWISAVQPVVENYIKDMSAKGLKPEETKARIEWYKKTAQELAKEQQAKGIPFPYTK